MRARGKKQEEAPKVLAGAVADLTDEQLAEWLNVYARCVNECYAELKKRDLTVGFTLSEYAHFGGSPTVFTEVRVTRTVKLTEGEL